MSVQPQTLSLNTDRLILRPWQLTDAADLYEYAQSPLVGPAAGWAPHISIEESRQILQNVLMTDEVFAIELKAEKKVIGSLGIHRRQPDPAYEYLKQREVGYVLNPAYWGRAYVPEAVEAVKLYAFNQLQLDILWCAHNINNAKSRRVCEKCGFEFRFERDGTRYYWIKPNS